MKPSRERIQQLRQSQDIGFHEAKKIATSELLVQAIDSARNLDDLKPILRRIVELLK